MTAHPEHRVGCVPLDGLPETFDLALSARVDAAHQQGAREGARSQEQIDLLIVLALMARLGVDEVVLTTEEVAAQSGGSVRMMHDPTTQTTTYQRST